MIRTVTSGLVLLCCVVLAGNACADNSVTSLRELIVLGLKNNLGLEVEKLDVLSSQQGITIEAADFDSQLFASSGYRHEQIPLELTSGTATDSHAKTLNTQAGVRRKFQTGLSTALSLNSEYITNNDLSNDLNPYSRSFFVLELTQPLLRNFGTDINTTRQQIAVNQSRQAALSYLLKAQNLTFLLESSINQLAGDAQLVKLRFQAESLASELYQANNKRFDAGLIAVTEVQEAQTALADRQLSLSLAEEQYALHKEDLKRQLQSRLSPQFDPVEMLSDIDPRPDDIISVDRHFSRARQQRLEFKISQYALDNSLMNKRYQENQRLPQLDLTAEAGLNGLSGSDRGYVPGTIYGGTWSDSLAGMSERDGYQWGVGLSFSVPLGNRSATARVQQADYQRKQQFYRLRDLEVEVKDELEQQLIVLQHTFDQLNLAKRFAALAQKSLDQEQRRLDEGLSDTFRLITFQDKMIQAQTGQVNATTRYRAALIKMAFLRGEIFQRHGIILTENSQEIDFETM